MYITVQGDTWDVVAKKVYGDELKAQLLMESNFRILDTFIFSAGVEIITPEITEGEEIYDLPEWRIVDE